MFALRTRSQVCLIPCVRSRALNVSISNLNVCGGRTTLSRRFIQNMSNLKRKEAPSKPQTASKKARIEVPEYHLSPSVREEDGSIQWPAPRSQIETATDVILSCARSQQKTLIVPDKDADGLSAGAILRHTLMLLGLPPEMIDIHLLSKGNTIHSEGERDIMKAYAPQFIFVLDQGSRPSPPVIDGDHNALIIDHHYATEDDFPKDSLHVTACNSPPVATSSLLTYLLCEPLHDRVSEVCDWLCVVGTHADLGNTIKWEAPFPDMKDCLKKYTKKVLNDVVSLINAPRRTPARDVRSAWDALCDTSDPRTILKTTGLISARQAIGDEVERCTHAAPKFSPDGKVALFRIRSQFQVHPMIATRWAGHLQSKNLEVVIVANEGYLAEKVNFSCRIPRCARNRDPPVDIIAQLKAFASLKGPPGEDNADIERLPLLERLGDDFARGHVQASGGIVGNEEFEELVRNMQIGVKPPPKPISQGSSPAKGKKVIDAGQKNNLLDFFGPKRPAPKVESS